MSNRFSQAFPFRPAAGKKSTQKGGCRTNKLVDSPFLYKKIRTQSRKTTLLV